MYYNYEKNKCSKWRRTDKDGRKEGNYGYRIGDGHRSIMEKLGILTDAAKYDVACTSSGSDRRGDGKGIGNAVSAGICHSFSGTGAVSAC